ATSLAMTRRSCGHFTERNTGVQAGQPTRPSIRSVLSTVGDLLREWRLQMGWAQEDAAKAVGVSRAAVTSWERGARQIPSDLLASLDYEYGARGALVDLARAIGSPEGFVSSEGPTPRRHWGFVLTTEPGPIWAWVRPRSGDRVSGYLKAAG